MRTIIRENEIKKIILKYINDKFDFNLTKEDVNLHTDDFHNITAEYEIDVND